jgi:hypothetical protein
MSAEAATPAEPAAASEALSLCLLGPLHLSGPSSIFLPSIFYGIYCVKKNVLFKFMLIFMCNFAILTSMENLQGTDTDMDMDTDKDMYMDTDSNMNHPCLDMSINICMNRNISMNMNRNTSMNMKPNLKMNKYMNKNMNMKMNVNMEMDSDTYIGMDMNNFKGTVSRDI